MGELGAKSGVFRPSDCLRRFLGLGVTGSAEVPNPYKLNDNSEF